MKAADLKFDERGLLPAIVQDARSGRVLMLAYMNAESAERTHETGETWFWSRSRNALWHKGETSGNTQRVQSLTPDCDRDTLLVQVQPRGPACHTGAESCFDDETATANLGATLERLYDVIESRHGERPEGSYTTYLFNEGLDKILKKLGEEATETVIAAKGDDDARLTSETADLLYHLVVLLVEKGVRLEQVNRELMERRK